MNQEKNVKRVTKDRIATRIQKDTMVFALLQYDAVGSFFLPKVVNLFLNFDGNDIHHAPS